MRYAYKVRRAKVHILSGTGKTLCQVENVMHGKEWKHTESDVFPSDRTLCLNCLSLQPKNEPRLAKPESVVVSLPLDWFS
jgi:hypothetical protein